jgi:hypothetical protein
MKNGVLHWPFECETIERGSTNQIIEMNLLGRRYAEATYRLNDTNTTIKFILQNGVIKMQKQEGPKQVEMNAFSFTTSTITIVDVPRNYSRWMESKQDKTLCQLCIPGTHNSGASWAYHSHILGRYFLCQENSITDQLYDGIRFFDFRVSDNGSQLCVSHRFVVTDFQPLLIEIQTFLQHHTTEVVIIHIKKDWNRAFSMHEQLEHELTKVLGHYIIRDSDDWSSKTIGDLCSMEKRALVVTDLLKGYVDMHTTMTGSWPSCHSSKPQELFENFDNKWFKECRPRVTCDRAGLSITDCIITPDGSSIARELVKMDLGLREGGKACNNKLKECLEGSWKTCFMNIVAMDFPDREVVEALINHNN